MHDKITVQSLNPSEQLAVLCLIFKPDVKNEKIMDAF